MLLVGIRQHDTVLQLLSRNAFWVLHFPQSSVPVNDSLCGFAFTLKTICLLKFILCNLYYAVSRRNYIVDTTTDRTNFYKWCPEVSTKNFGIALSGVKIKIKLRIQFSEKTPRYRDIRHFVFFLN